ncbi:MAG: AMP-binding protein [Phycisphaerae bacterium]
MDAPSETTDRRIRSRLAGEHILVTGATGFLAKVFVEKLLRAVPEIGRIHLLVRPRSDGTSAGHRVGREVFGSNAFDRLRAAWGPSFEDRWREKVSVVSGDLTHERFGLSASAYRELAGQVTLVVNSAATVTFDERLDAAIALNVEGPRRLLRFAKDCGDVPYTHVSTAYVSGVQTGDIPEALIPPGHTVASYIASCQPNREGSSQPSMDLDETLVHLQQLVGEAEKRCAGDGSACRRALIDVGMEHAQRHGWHDTYTYTKWLAEQFLARDRGAVPLVLLRPAIIEGSYEEPAPGWIDGLRMADPLILAYGRGKLKEFPADAGAAIDFIPVDFVANAMIATLPARRRGPALEIYQCGSSSRNPITMGELIYAVKEAFRRRPMRDESGRPIRVSELRLVPRRRFAGRWGRRLKTTQRLRQALKSTKMAPRYRKRLATAEVQIAQLLYFVKIYSPYTHLKCRYLDDRLRAVLDSMHPEDRRRFPFDVERIDWHEYLVHRHVPGVRHFVLGSGTELEAPMLAAGYAVESESPDAPPPAQVLAALRGESIFDVFENAANTYPSRIALQVRRNGRWVRYTYADALATTTAIARRFAEFGLTQGDHIAIYAENGPEWGLTYLAAMRCGLTVVPLDRQLPAADVLDMSRFADVRLICTSSRAYQELRVAGDEADRDGAIELVEMNSAFVPPAGTSRDPGPEPATVPGDAIASIVYTSGTTVEPKGVMLRHCNFLSNARSLVHVQPVHADDQFLSVLPMHHVFEFTGGFLVPMANASTVTYVEQLTGAQIVSTMQATGTTVMMVVPRLLKLFYDGIRREVDQGGVLMRAAFRLLGWISERSHGELGGVLFARVHKRFGGRLRMFVCGGSALPEFLFHAFRRLGFPVYEGYGLTETTPVLTVNPQGGPRAGSVGLPLPEVELEIRNQDGSGVGELYVRGPNVMAGYYKNEQATRDVLCDGWFRTGDLCRRNAEGFLYVSGRAKDVIVTAAGKNVYPDEVAAHYAGLPHAKELCVLAMPNADGIGDRVDAVVVLDANSITDRGRSAVEAEVRDAVARQGERLASHQRIQNLHFQTEEVPRTTTLKVKRAAVVQALLAREHHRRIDGLVSERSSAVTGLLSRPAVSPNEGWLRETLTRLTSRPASRIRPESHLLLDLGVDSLMKIQILGEIEAQFGVQMSDQVSTRVSRVSDLLAVIGDRAMLEGKKRDEPSWRRRLRIRQGDGLVAGRSDGRNGRIPLPLWPLRWAVRGSIGLMLHSYIRVKAHGLANLPKQGAFILTANHSSHLDSAAVISAIGRALRGTGRRCYVAAAEDYFFNTPFKAMVFGDLCDTVPFDRNSDGVEGLRRCSEKLADGQPLLLFPEGTRSVTGEIQPFKIGAAVLAVEMQVPIVPVHIENTYELLPKGHRIVRPGVVTVRFGRPLKPADVSGLAGDGRYRVYREMSAEVRDQVVALEQGRRLAHVQP